MSPRRYPFRSCRQVLRVLQSYLDGVLDDRTAGHVARHLEGCRGCVLEAETYREIKNSLARRGRTSPIVVLRLCEFGETVQEKHNES